MGGARDQGLRRGQEQPGRQDPDVDDVFEVLERSHRQLEERLSELQQAASAIVRERAGPGELAAVDAVINYLERSAVRHEEDEEHSLFPRLRRAPGGLDLAALLEDLTVEHVLHGHLIKQLRSLRTRWPAAGPDAGDSAALVILANELARAYRSHIDREERDLLPTARDRLGQADRDAIRAEMRKRRGGGGGDGGGRNGGHHGGRRRNPAGSTGPRIREF